MSITLNLDPDVENSLSILAQERGVSLSDYIHEVVDREAARALRPSTTSGEERAAAFLKWADSFPDVPLLSDEAISRASLYPAVLPQNDHRLERSWVSSHRSAYLGQWVALSGETLLASGPTAADVYRAARAIGISAPYVVLVEAENTIPFAGW